MLNSAAVLVPKRRGAQAPNTGRTLGPPFAIRSHAEETRVALRRPRRAMNDVGARSDRDASQRRALPVPVEDLRAIDRPASLPTVIEWPFDLSVEAKTASALFACLLLAAVMAFHLLGERGIFSPAEARYCLIAREMIESQDWIQPRFNHVRYDEKP